MDGVDTRSLSLGKGGKVRVYLEFLFVNIVMHVFFFPLKKMVVSE
jgi:hypothetical protein